MYVVAYDIEDDRTRGKVAALLEGYGHRVQESVFECRVDATAVDELIGRMKKELKDPASGQVRIYRVCESCQKASLGVGQIKSVDTPDCYIV